MDIDKDADAYGVPNSQYVALGDDLDPPAGDGERRWSDDEAEEAERKDARENDDASVQVMEADGKRADADEGG